MERIRLANNQDLAIIINGVHSTDKELNIRFTPEGATLTALDELLSDKTVTSKIVLLSDADEELRIYSGYTKIKTIRLDKNVIVNTTVINEETGEEEYEYADVVTVILAKPNETEEKIASLEDQVTNLQVALCEIYESKEEE
jgi:hypothetical protein